MLGRSAIENTEVGAFFVHFPPFGVILCGNRYRSDFHLKQIRAHPLVSGDVT